MTLVRPQSSLRPQTPENLGLDVGRSFINCALDELFDVDDPTTVVDRLLSTPWLDENGIEQTPYQGGATQGGIDYTMGITQRQVDIDGRRANIKGLWRVDMVEPSLKMNYIESRDPEIMHKAHGAATKTRVGMYHRIKPGFIVDDDVDYWWNMVILQTVSGYALPQLYIIQNPHVSAQETLSMKDKAEMVLPITVTGNLPASDPFGDVWAPCEVWVPDSSVS